jgi:ABC-type nitrate/sulfonate/bicarbonate transport system ATPase subunit
VTSTQDTVAVSGLQHRFGERPVFEDLNFGLRAGEVLAVLGRSGAGKSTLLRFLAGRAKPTRGEVVICGQRDARARAKVAYCAQEPVLLPWLSVSDNIHPPTRLRRARSAPSTELAVSLGLERVMTARVGNLSGGERQRVALARAIRSGRSVLVLDEPLNAVDALVSQRCQAALRRASTEEVATIVLSTHSLDDAIGLADKMLVLSGDGTYALIDNVESGVALDQRSAAFRQRLLDLMSIPGR